jgi:hypothetical protein
MEDSGEHRFYDAAARCSPDPHWADSAHLIDAAVRGLADGLDSPSLRDLAGAPRSVQVGELRSLLLDALDELSIPRPDSASPGQTVVDDGTTYARLATDVLRLEIAPVREGARGFEILIHVNDLEITSAGAGMGMPPFRLLVPTNRLVANADPRREVVASCTCGEPGCGSTEARITRDGNVVHWEWYVDVPMGNGVSFDARAYDAEVDRIAADQSWQRPADAVSRRVLEEVDRDALARAGLELSWAAEDFRDARTFLVSLYARDDGFQVFLRFRLDGRSTEQVADEVLRTLQRSPSRWHATYHSMQVGRRGRPPMAGRRWRSEDPW